MKHKHIDVQFTFNGANVGSAHRCATIYHIFWRLALVRVYKWRHMRGGWRLAWLRKDAEL